MRRALSFQIALVLLLSSCGPKPPVHDIVEAEGDSVRIARAQVADGRVHFFTFVHEDRNVNFLIRTDRTGTLRAHLDACYGCYRYTMGYVVEASDLVCRACRLKYPIGDEEWDFIGACAPIALRARVEGDYVLIDRPRLEKAARYF